MNALEGIGLVLLGGWLAARIIDWRSRRRRRRGRLEGTALSPRWLNEHRWE